MQTFSRGEKPPHLRGMERYLKCFNYIFLFLLQSLFLQLAVAAARVSMEAFLAYSRPTRDHNTAALKVWFLQYVTKDKLTASPSVRVRKDTENNSTVVATCWCFVAL
uniref:Uncharacterized protein n=1 Tax=Sphaerodactylus townsendi TaxID=933632 RepID=A0ACB8F2E8_9SAUR